MDVVQSAIRALRGRVSVQTRQGEGTRITLLIPVTLAFLESMVVTADGHLFVIPIESISEVFKPEESQVVTASAEGEELVRRQEALIPVFRISTDTGVLSSRALSECIIVVVQSSRGRVGIPVDAIIGQQQVMMKPLSGHLRGIQGGAGCALLGSGEVAIALDIERLLVRMTA
jgi:two-component system chemotaxis sensor kinase CheA